MDIQQELVKDTLKALIGKNYIDQTEVLRNFAQEVTDMAVVSHADNVRVTYRAAALQGLLANPEFDPFTNSWEHQPAQMAARALAFGDVMFAACTGNEKKQI